MVVVSRCKLSVLSRSGVTLLRSATQFLQQITQYIANLREMWM